MWLFLSVLVITLGALSAMVITGYYEGKSPEVAQIVKRLREENASLRSEIEQGAALVADHRMTIYAQQREIDGYKIHLRALPKGEVEHNGRQDAAHT